MLPDIRKVLKRILPRKMLYVIYMPSILIFISMYYVCPI